VSLSEAREEITAALSTVAVLHAHPERPATMVPGTAWPFWRGWTLSAGTTGLPISGWEVIVVTGKTERSATDFVDEHLADVVDALRPAGWFTAVDPIRFPTEAGDVFAVSVKITRE
jgi:hypothetical protein